ncbi:F-box/LRR-repeat protein 15-like isoform X3 [Magnolia sinica]|uniref:F-box/LRR-repeat protein 15-like isoform X3 n=1 Tax=Magnolia sinica TaxID=86752 RepID=UPI00265A1E7F|nr:F-box/LRR-repeat protein 15-like isoform X3 [Magnolia sinica]
MADGSERRMGNAESDGLQLGFSRWRDGPGGRSDGLETDIAAREHDEGERSGWEQTIGRSSYFERYGSVAGHREGLPEVLAEIGCGSDGEEMACLGSKRVDCDWDFTHKRAKVLFHSEACHYAVMASGADASTSAVDGHNSISQGSSVPSENEMVLNLSSVSNDVGGRNPTDANGGEDDDGDGSNISKIEDLEVRMDLTDDLLHMVFSFLVQIDLCRAARVCRQWRAASAHEDFWRCLNFENRNISSFQSYMVTLLCWKSVRLPMLTDLKLHTCEGITSASMAAISHCSMLEELVLDCCGLLTSVSLDLPRLQNISLVHCRKYRSLFVDLNLRSPMLSSITISNCPALHRINITSNSLRKLVLQKQESLVTVLLQCISLEEVDLTECESLTNSICEVFSDGGGCPMLRSLVLDNCDSLMMVGFHSTSLVSLSLVGCRAMTSLELACPNLEQVHLDGCDHLERASFCPVGLRSLNLGICPKLSSLQIVAPQMSCLELKGCGVLSQASIICPCLTSLDASFCSQLTDDCLAATTASCPYIESLILMSCPSIGPDGLSSLRRLPNLTYLDLSYTFLMNLQPVFESCLQLKVLKLQACKYLSNSSLDSLYKEGALPALCELDLSYGTICQSAIEELLTCCTHLTHVSLNGCINMHDLNWCSSRATFSESSSDNISPGCMSLPNDHDLIEHPDRLLQNLNCVGCQNIKKVVIPPMARCFHLSSLNLSLSANLKEVDLACFNLSFLNLSNCCSLEILKLDCPRLTSLSLQSCNIAEEEVEAAISHCSMLETLDIRLCPKVYGAGMGRLRTVCPSLKRIFSSLSA